MARLRVFGSAEQGSDFDPDVSDADFLIELNLGSSRDTFHHYCDLLDALRQVLGRPVDLVEPDAIRNRHLRDAINPSRKVVH